MKRVLVGLLMVLLLIGCSARTTPDIATTVRAAVAVTLTAWPSATDTPTETPAATATETHAPTTTPHVAATVQAAVDATVAALPTEALTATPTREPVATVSRPPAPTSPPYTHTLRTYQGQGYSFQVPAGARLEEVAPGKDPWQRVIWVTSEVHLTGPQVWVRHGDADWGWRGAAYELVVQTYENPDRLDAEAWARAYIRASWQEAVARKRPWGSLPVSEDGQIDERKLERVVVAGQPGCLVWYFAFDSSRPAYYVASDGQIVEFSFQLYPVVNQPLAMVQRDVYALILDSLTLHDADATP